MTDKRPSEAAIAAARSFWRAWYTGDITADMSTPDDHEELALAFDAFAREREEAVRAEVVRLLEALAADERGVADRGNPADRTAHIVTANAYAFAARTIRDRDYLVCEDER